MISSIPKWLADLFGSSLRPNVKVLETHYISSHIKKIRFQGDISKWSFQIGYANVIRVTETEYRNYTVAYHDKKKGIFDIIFHIHGNGVGSQYMDTLKANDELFVSLPRGKKFYEPNVQQQFIFGDETSLGLVCSLLPLLKKHKHQFHFYFELDEANKSVPALLDLENYTVFQKNGSFRNEKWINDLPVFQTTDWKEARFILTGNVKSVQTFRKVLKHRRTGKISSQGYWLEGKKGL
ncbi:FAD-binding oxidoreductase [Myroides indicus]|uniref:Flavin-dependent oxidoreductase n=1 Tax=Myroides indicus TaxID=1323422 RepID=A0A4V3E7Q0_9FLAO|nr:FAD-binding oxidoreductase [Myroides indicus]TDS52994.1 flavin-dependent oxidoreductase [Myroides indicus]